MNFTDRRKNRIAALGDIHVRRDQKGAFVELFEEISKSADVLALCGDLTEGGFIEEAENLAESLSALTIPAVAVLGNHEYELGTEKEIVKILKRAKIHFLEDGPTIINEIGFAGTKGFGGGFRPHLVASFGEPEIKNFVVEAVNDALRLEHSLASLGDKKKFVVLHYSPISQTVRGEPAELFPFLGNSRLEAAINQFEGVQAIFHGHAHHGSLKGQTSQGVDVYNCSYPLCLNLFKKKKLQQPYILVEV